jgi:hypothetical protein
VIDTVYRDARPYTRWWWFSGVIDDAAVRAQLDWVKAAGFGGVEIAWVYPQPGAEAGPDWLSTEWSAAVACAKGYATAIGLGCDFTFGTLWPFGGSFVTEADSSRTWRGPSTQRLGRSWELPHAPPGRILNHLDRAALGRYAERLGRALGDALQASPSALFCDSWEVEPDGLWADGFADDFLAHNGYDVLPFMERLDEHPDVRYDYRRLLADWVLDEFYRPFTAECHRRGAIARMQCHGAPTDLLAAYAAVDVPESEAVLFDPPFARFAASAAALTGRPLVSAEAFTCLYGWEPYPGPGPYQGREQLADLKLVADALFANGVNFVIWHGMPFSPPGAAQRFYATVHVGPDAAFAAELPAFNAYLERVSAHLRRGTVAADLGVYLPLEDNWMRGELSPALRRPSAVHHWELQTERLPLETLGYRPLWVSAPFLEQATFADGLLQVGAVTLRAVHVDVEWLDPAALTQLLRLARQGLPLSVKRRPRAPGRRPSPGYAADLERLLALDNVVTAVDQLGLGAPFLEGADPPEYWCRRDGDALVQFVAHPLSKTVTYPLPYGQAWSAGPVRWSGRLNTGARSRAIELVFEPYQSLLLRVEADGGVTYEDIALDVKPPERATSA